MTKSPDPTRFLCGHLREGNSTNGAHPQCVRCKKAYNARRYAAEKSAVFKCGHAKSKDNTALVTGKPRCRACKLEAHRRWKAGETSGLRMHLTPFKPLPSEVVPASDAGRSYSLFPPKRRSA